MPMNRKKSKPRRSTSYTTSSAASTPMSHPPVRKVSQSISEPCVYVMSSVRPCRENTPRATPAVTTTFDPVPNSITFREGMGLLRGGVRSVRVRPVYTRVGRDGPRGRRNVTLIGASIKRVEDYRLLIGGGRFVADLRRPGAVSAVIVRSPHSHARIVRVDTRAARAHPGVLGCLT